jgi:hypothetical protein
MHMTLFSNGRHITPSAWYLNAVYLSQHQSPSWIRVASSEVEPLIANDRSLKFSGGHPRRVSYMYNFADVLNLNVFVALAARLTNSGGSDRGR